MKRLILIVGAIVVLAVLLVGVGLTALVVMTGETPANAVRQTLMRGVMVIRADDLQRPAGFSDQPQRFTVESTDNARTIGEKLDRVGLVSDADLFVGYTIAEDIDVELEAGTYFLSQVMTIPQIAYRLTDSSSSQLPFRILEGWRVEQVADAIDENGLFAFEGSEFLALVGPGAAIPPEFGMYVDLPIDASLEGFLFPDTYLLPPDISAEGLRDFLLDTFRERVTVAMAQDALVQGYSLYEIVTLASIAEREALHDDEHAAIMGVYRNRLESGIKLDADPTIQYALDGARGRWWPAITRADYLGVISPYNTYLGPGLPPGPISNPGLSAIQAAIYPEESEYIFFRAACDRSGYHEFAVTYEEHLQNGCTG